MSARALRLQPQSVAAFHAELVATLGQLGVVVHIWIMPSELAHPIDFTKDTIHASYDPDYASRFWRALIAITTVLTEFRGGFIGKASPVHFFWGSFDLAATRFFGSPRAAHSQRRQHHPRRLLPRGMQRRLMAGQRDDEISRLLCLCLSRA
jgi:hypothetical protein